MDIASITTREIRSALDAIRAARSLDDHPLSSLRLLRARLAREGVAESPESRAWALGEILHELVTGRLNALRSARDGDETQGAELSGALETLARDFGHDDIELEAWSAVYHRFLCPDLQTLRGSEVASIALPTHSGRSGERFFVRRMQRALKALEGRLRLMEREALAEIAASDGPDRPDDSAAPPPMNLPQPRGPLIGRELELATLLSELAPGGLVSLVGPAGVGKTRLALEAARAIDRRRPVDPGTGSGRETETEAETRTDSKPSIGHGAVVAATRFRDGVAFAALDAVSSQEHLDGAILDALHSGEAEGGEAPGEEASPEAVIGSRRLLLVLDNAEHLVRAVAERSVQLLEACPRLGLLCTSQERLRVGRERVMELGALALGETAAKDAADGDLAPALQLFLYRAEHARPGFDPDAADLESVAEICRRLDGIPLAIELAAARSRILDTAEIADRLDDRLRLLSIGDRDLPERHRSLETALDWSYNLLDAPARRLLRRLSVFRGSFGLPAAEEVCSGPDLRPEQVLDLAQELVDRSLLQRESGVGGGRLRLLESVRLYARGRLREAGEQEIRRDRHLRAFLSLAQRAEGRLRGRDQMAWQARLAADADNIRAALDHACARPERVDEGLRLAIALRWFWIQRGAAAEGRRWVERLIAARDAWPEASQRPELEGAAAEAAGALARCLCDYPAARAHLHRSLDFVGADQGRRRASILRSLGNVAEEEGDRDAALEAYVESLSLYEAAADTWGTAAVRNNLGLLHQHAGRSEDARRELEASLASFRSLGEEWAVGVTLFNLANVASDSDELEAAAAHYRESLVIAERIGDLEGEASARLGLANVARHADRPDEARRHHRSAQAHLDALGDRQRQAEWLEGAAALLEPDDALVALAFLAAAESLRVTIGAPAAPAEAERILARRRALEAGVAKEAALRAILRGQREGWELAAAEGHRLER